jgi:hypothetical protein
MYCEKNYLKLTILLISIISIGILGLALAFNSPNIGECNEAYALTAFEENDNENTAPILLIDGEENTGSIFLERGKNIAIDIEYDNKKYIPTVYTDCTDCSVYCDNGIVSLDADSKLTSELIIELYCEFDDGNVFGDKINIIPTVESNIADDINFTVYNDVLTTYIDNDDIVSIDTSLIGLDGSIENVDTSDGTEIKINSGISGVQLNSVNINTIDANGEENEQSVVNDTEVLSVSDFIPTVMLFSSGSGTQADPYLISNEDDLDNIATTAGNANLYYLQTTNFTVYASSTDFNEVDFYGHYDGGGYTITIYDLTNQYSAFCRDNYGYISNVNFSLTYLLLQNILSNGIICRNNNGTVYNVDVTSVFPVFLIAMMRIQNGTFTPPGHFCSYAMRFPGLVGGIAANNQESGLIEECIVQIDAIIDSAAFGAIAGMNNGTVRNCRGRSLVMGKDIKAEGWGGLVGVNNNSGYITCDSTSYAAAIFVIHTIQDTSAQPSIGSICGENYGGIMPAFTPVINIAACCIYENNTYIALTDAQKTYVACGCGRTY